ncbi:MAG: hypothetical protein KDE01_04700 [Caldilineaceae bacterium]|nr:hypothetical protein [Caldilineaceae bacterium]
MIDPLPAPALSSNFPPTDPARGLGEEEAARRRAQGFGNDAQVKTGRTYGQIVRDNLFTFFNVVLFGLAAVLLVLGSPRDAFFTGAIALLNAVIATIQEVRAKRKLDAIALLTRPTATVVRDGAAQTIDPAAVVIGDILDRRTGRPGHRRRRGGRRRDSRRGRVAAHRRGRRRAQARRRCGLFGQLCHRRAAALCGA